MGKRKSAAAMLAIVLTAGCGKGVARAPSSPPRSTSDSAATPDQVTATAPGETPPLLSTTASTIASAPAPIGTEGSATHQPAHSYQPELRTTVTLAARSGSDDWAVVSSCVDEVCHAAVERSTGGGAWAIMHRFAQLPSYGGKLTIVVASPRDVWARLDADRAAVVTHDGGATWLTVGAILDDMRATGRTVWALFCAPHINGHGCTVASGPASADALTPVAAPPTALGFGPSLALAVTDGGTAVVTSAGRDQVDATSDGGRTWRTGRSPCAHDYAWSRSLDWAGGVLWLVCTDEWAAGTQRKVLYRSIDDGRTWRAGAALEFSGYASTLRAVNASTAWRFGPRGSLHRTTDSGQTWLPQLADRFGEAGGGHPVDDAVVASNGDLLVSLRSDVFRISASGRVLSRTAVLDP